MKTKLSALEELRQERAKLLEGCAEDKLKLQDKLGYAKSNFGSLLLHSFFSSTKSGLSEAFSIITGNENKKKRKRSSGLGSVFASIAPAAWNLLQPILIGLLVKKVKSSLFKKKKK